MEPRACCFTLGCAVLFLARYAGLGSIRGTAAAALLLLLYNGERSRKPHPKLNKAFYAAYPLHLVVIWAMVIAAEGPLTQLKLLKYYL